MRSLTEVYKEIKFHEDAIDKLQDEIKNFQNACPHPDNFLSVKHKDHYDGVDAPIYEQTYSTAKCALCGKSHTIGYYAKEGQSFFSGFKYKEAREVISGKT